MSKYIVTATAIDRQTRERVGEVRDEVIDTETNGLFGDARTAHDVERIYESFWNDMNPHSLEVVKVIGVENETHSS